jgi:hypothetical protein
MQMIKNALTADLSRSLTVNEIELVIKSSSQLPQEKTLVPFIGDSYMRLFIELNFFRLN